MIANLKPYPEMKESGVEWLGDVPEHWEVRQLGRIGRFSKGNGGTKEDEVADGVPCVRYGDLYTQHRFFVRNSRACITEEKAADYTPILHGDVLFAGSGETIEEIGKSAVNLMSEPACCGGDVILFRPSIEVDANFFGYATDCPQATYQKSCMGRGITVMHIYGDKLKYMYVALPLLPEQAAIVRYLDYVDRQIRKYISAKQKLIGLLEEQKQAIIHRAVTRGLDPNVPLKPSGVEWLGDVPEHWDVKRLRECGMTISGMTPSMENRRFWDGDVPWVTPKDMKIPAIGNSSVKVSESAIQETSLRLIHPPAILFVVRGMILARKVPIAWTTSAVTINQDIKALRTDCGINASFLARFLDSSQQAFSPLIDEAGHGTRRLPTERWQNLRVLIPPVNEQAAIVEYLDKISADINTAIDHARREIELLREYRTRLIADVVTGKLDVREAAARLPDEAEEPESFNDADAASDMEEETELVGELEA